MKILFLESHPIWIYGLPNGFKEEGHTVMISGPLSKDNISEMLDLFKPDLIIYLGWTNEHSKEKWPWIREAIKKTTIPLVYWATEDPLHTENFTKPLINAVKPDFVFTVTPSLCEKYEKLGFKADHLDFGYHQSVHYPVQPFNNYRCDIAVVANAYPDYLKKNPESFRAEALRTLIKPLIKKGIRVDFWGNHWDKMGEYIGSDIPTNWIHGYLDYRDAYKVYSSAKIVIGLQNSSKQLTMRTFEILGSGGVLLTTDTPAVREKFTPGQDLIVSSGRKETVSKIQEYLKNDLERQQIRENGQKAVQDHSYRNRAKRILEVLENRGILRDIGEIIHYSEFLKEIYEIYKISPDDTLAKIANRYNVPIEQLIELNNLSSDKIYAGQIIKIKKKHTKNNF
ncbi:peptigoglycan-binding protein LysM [Bacillus sp. AFS076308]|uniref:glycosyltransferase family protein n=1 Tax=unclassified Bacillus (in: firmicutes) TaxID=185979 RepID=UPI000BF52458|nr:MULTISPECIES: glycosyltransferase [unclassified Bacillus (in: firmicutes)]PFN82002.1 peptigoglycan-binding protein LysM [Bacillus sp. AFS076308]PGV54741.1 peptigoglycan-binding protein LysM [Bacillus sp. AFS037270]